MRWVGTVFVAVVTVGCLMAADPPARPVVVPRSEQMDLKSPAGRVYRLFLQAPAPDSPVPPGGYPVYYFTDANTAFPLVASLARIQQMTIEPVVLIGIGYPTDDRKIINTRRAFDLTPVAAPGVWKRFQDALGARNRGSRPAPNPTLTFGGQEEFFTFIQEEVKPMIEKRFKIDTKRQALFGHSFGGLFTLHTLYTHPDSFQTFIAASPSLWLNPGKLAEEEAAFTQAKSRPRLLVTLWELEPPLPFGNGDGGTDPREALTQQLKAAGSDTTFTRFAGENHGSVVPFAHMHGLRFAFEQPTVGSTP